MRQIGTPASEWKRMRKDAQSCESEKHHRRRGTRSPLLRKTPDIIVGSGAISQIIVRDEGHTSSPVDLAISGKACLTSGTSLVSLLFESASNCARIRAVQNWSM